MTVSDKGLLLDFVGRFPRNWIRKSYSIVEEVLTDVADPQNLLE